MLRRLLAALLVFAVGSVALAPAAFALGRPKFTCDVPVPARVDVHQSGDVGARPARLSVAQEGSAQSAVAGRRSSTTPFVPRDATEAAADTTDALAGYRSFRAAKADLGSPGAGNVYDHVVEQSQIGRSGFAPEEIHSPFNLDPVDAGINQAKANYYSSIRPFTGGQTVRDWLTGQTFAEQHAFGMRVNGLLQSGVPLP